MKLTKEESLQYHSSDRKGKIEVVATKPCLTARDLSMAYTPGAVSYTHLRAHETVLDLVCRLLLEKTKMFLT